MVVYKRPKNLRDMIVRADVRLKVPRKIPTPTSKPQKNAKSLTFPKPPTSMGSQKQPTLREFLSTREHLPASTSLTQVNKKTQNTPIVSRS